MTATLTLHDVNDMPLLELFSHDLVEQLAPHMNAHEAAILAKAHLTAGSPFLALDTLSYCTLGDRDLRLRVSASRNQITLLDADIPVATMDVDEEMIAHVANIIDDEEQLVFDA